MPVRILYDSDIYLIQRESFSIQQKALNILLLTKLSFYEVIYLFVYPFINFFIWSFTAVKTKRKELLNLYIYSRTDEIHSQELYNL